MDGYSEYIFKSRYARYLEGEGRRETWPETINRYLDFFEGRFPKVVKPVRSELYEAIHSMEVMPSMRALMTAGPALDRDEAAGYNCSYLAIDSPRAFDEALYLLLCGVGVGYSVERQFITKLPEVPESLYETSTVIRVADSKIGWARALKETVSLLFGGDIPSFDFSSIRPAGAPLKTFGGRASGPEPLERMLNNVISIFRGANGRLTSLECHDIMCHIAECVVVGGVRRAAMISLSNMSDPRMATAKSGQWWMSDGQRALANNSIAYTDKPDVGGWMKEWNTLYESRSGERGIFNRQAAKLLSPERRDKDHEFGTNPCSEIVLRSKQTCNLTEVVVRPKDREADLERKIGLAAILGTLQATLTNFRYLSSSWKKNCEEERLLGVSLTGIYDSPWLLGLPESSLRNLRDHAVSVNEKYAAKLGINPSTAVTCVKPSGTVSQLVDSASGIHPRAGHHYWRRVRGDKMDPVSDALIDSGVPHMTDPYNQAAWSFTFAKKAPKGATVNADITAIEHLEVWKRFALGWCEHKPSVTVSVAEDEWPEVGAWCYKNFYILSGVSFLPKDSRDHTYEEAPYELCSAEDIKGYPKLRSIDWNEVGEYQLKETEFACSAGICDI